MKEKMKEERMNENKEEKRKMRIKEIKKTGKEWR